MGVNQPRQRQTETLAFEGIVGFVYWAVACFLALEISKLEKGSEKYTYRSNVNPVQLQLV